MKKLQERKAGNWNLFSINVEVEFRKKADCLMGVFHVISEAASALEINPGFLADIVVILDDGDAFCSNACVRSLPVP